MDRYIAIFLPILWAVVASLLSLLLYKTSESVYEETARSKGKVKRMRLVGSIFIAVIVFWGLEQYSPRNIIDEMAAGQTRILSSDLSYLSRATVDLNNATEELAACIQVTTAQECRIKFDSLRTRVSDVESANKQIQKNAH